MKKSLALLALASLFIGMTSCRKKDEPKPVVPVLPNTIDASADAATIKNAQAVLTVQANSIVYISPKKGLNILGATMDKSDSTKFTVGPSGLLGINGNVEMLTIQSDDATEISLSKPSSQLKRLRILSKSRNASAAKTTIDLSGATELEGLLVAGYTMDLLDLTKQTKLRYLALGGFNWKNYNFVEMTKFLGSPSEMDTSIEEVKLPANNVIEYVAGRTPFQSGKFDIDNLPKLKKFFWQSPAFANLAFAKSQDLEVVFATAPWVKLNADLGNKPKLQDITLYNATLSKLAVSNTTAANLLKGSSAPAEVVELDNIDPAQAVSYIKRTAGTTTKSITLKNMNLTEAQIREIISGLGATNGTLKVKSDLLTAKVKADLEKIKWEGVAL
jgi:lipoprotein